MVQALSDLTFIVFCTYLVWSPSAVILFICKQFNRPLNPRAKFYWRVLKWPALAGIILMWIDGLLVVHLFNTPDNLILGLLLTYWLAFRNVGKEQPPKQDPKQLRARVKQVGGRLVLVPRDDV